MSSEYCEITIQYDPRKMSPTPLRYLIREVSKIANEFTPRLKVNVKIRGLATTVREQK